MDFLAQKYKCNEGCPDYICTGGIGIANREPSVGLVHELDGGETKNTTCNQPLPHVRLATLIDRAKYIGLGSARPLSARNVQI